MEEISPDYARHLWSRSVLAAKANVCAEAPTNLNHIMLHDHCVHPLLTTARYRITSPRRRRSRERSCFRLSVRDAGPDISAVRHCAFIGTFAYKVACCELWLTQGPLHARPPFHYSTMATYDRSHNSQLQQLEAGAPDGFCDHPVPPNGTQLQPPQPKQIVLPAPFLPDG